MGRECDVVHGGKRMIGSQRFGVEHVEAIPDGAASRRWKRTRRLFTLIARQPDLTLDEIVAASRGGHVQ